MNMLYKGPLPNPALINERIRHLNHIIHAISQWREPPLDAQWPVLVKDNIDVKGLRATAGRKGFGQQQAATRLKNSKPMMPSALKNSVKTVPRLLAKLR